VEAALEEVLDELRETEVERRVKVAVGVQVFRPRGKMVDLRHEADYFLKKTAELLNDEKLRAHEQEAIRIVDKLKEIKKRREYFHGKEILHRFYKKHLGNTGLARSIFIYECSRNAGKRQMVRNFVSEFAMTIGLVSGEL
jgi:hypothetical protein